MTDFENELKEAFVDTIIEDAKEKCVAIKQLMDKGVSLEDALEVYKIPPEFVCALTDIDVPTKTFIVPVQVLTEGYIAVNAINAYDAIITAERHASDIKIVPSKLSAKVSNESDPVATPLRDTDIVNALTKAHEKGTLKAKLLETPANITSVSKSFTKDSFKEFIINSFLSEDEDDDDECCCGSRCCCESSDECNECDD